jgi:hypothetical protein
MKKGQKSKDGREIITKTVLKTMFDEVLNDKGPIDIYGTEYLPSNIHKRLNSKKYERGLKEFYDSVGRFYCKTYEG